MGESPFLTPTNSGFPLFQSGNILFLLRPIQFFLYFSRETSTPFPDQFRLSFISVGKHPFLTPTNSGFSFISVGKHPLPSPTNSGFPLFQSGNILFLLRLNCIFSPFSREIIYNITILLKTSNLHPHFHTTNHIIPCPH